MKTAHGFSGSFKYEFLMQLRRPALWLVILVTGLFVFGSTILPSPLEQGANPLHLVADKTSTVAFFLLATTGILLADRSPRDRALKTTELLKSFPTSLGARWWGKYLGVTLATAVPIALLCLATIGYYALLTRDMSLFALEPLVFAAIVLPGIFFIGAFSLVCTLALPTALYSILFIGYWVWGNLVPPRLMPTLNCTLLMPSGGYAESGFFGGGAVCDGSTVTATAAQAWESILLLLACAALAMLIGQFYLNWRTAKA